MTEQARLVLVLNSGSSSIKYQLIEVGGRGAIAIGLLERIGSDQARLSHRRRNGTRAGDATGDDWHRHSSRQPIADHRAGLALIEQTLAVCDAMQGDGGLYGVGHRVVHGGDRFRQAQRVTAEVIEQIRDTVPLAPLHNPANLAGIEAIAERMPAVPQVAVFDTAFHQTLPAPAYTYALPRQLCQDQRIRRYGFHGISHGYISRLAAERLGRAPADLKMVTLHLGNGASAAAIDAGRSVDTTMGMTPLEGLVMGTRSGDLDPAIPLYLMRETGLDAGQVDVLMNQRSGLLGLAGIADMRELLGRVEQGDQQAELALALFCYRIKKTIGAYAAVLGRLDALVFTGGIGEHAAEVRRRVADGLGLFGIELDDERNRRPGPDGAIHRPGTTPLLVLPTNEELEIALQTVAVIDAEADAKGDAEAGAEG